tara:strand:- start:331 stop:480 length:150 start_codon:yes stop_codon:yes gene_type:complete
MDRLARLIKLKLELDKVAVREPRTAEQYKNRTRWDRVKNILSKRYNRED